MYFLLNYDIRLHCIHCYSTRTMSSIAHIHTRPIFVFFCGEAFQFDINRGRTVEYYFFLSNCCNSLGGDSHVVFVIIFIRIASFMTTMGTNYIVSINETPAEFNSKRPNFPLTHWARAEITIMNRTSECASMLIANRICRIHKE